MKYFLNRNFRAVLGSSYREIEERACWRLIVCRNPALAAERARKREELLAASEGDLADIRAATMRARNPLRGQDKIALRVGSVLGRRKVAKHFRLTITENSFGFVRDAVAIAREKAARGISPSPRRRSPRFSMAKPIGWPTAFTEWRLRRRLVFDKVEVDVRQGADAPTPHEA